MRTKINQVLISATRRATTVKSLNVILVLLTVAGVSALLLNHMNALISIFTFVLLILIFASFRNEYQKYKELQATREMVWRVEIAQTQASHPSEQATASYIDTTLNTVPWAEDSASFAGNESTIIDGADGHSYPHADTTPHYSLEDLPPSYEDCPSYEECMRNIQRT